MSCSCICASNERGSILRRSKGLISWIRSRHAEHDGCPFSARAFEVGAHDVAAAGSWREVLKMPARAPLMVWTIRVRAERQPSPASTSCPERSVGIVPVSAAAHHHAPFASGRPARVPVEFCARQPLFLAWSRTHHWARFAPTWLVMANFLNRTPVRAEPQLKRFHQLQLLDDGDVCAACAGCTRDQKRSSCCHRTTNPEVQGTLELQQCFDWAVLLRDCSGAQFLTGTLLRRRSPLQSTKMRHA